MKGIAKCPKCGKLLTTNCGGCIIAGTDIHKCKRMKNVDIVSGIKWKEVPETKKELLKK